MRKRHRELEKALVDAAALEERVAMDEVAGAQLTRTSSSSRSIF